MCVRPRARTSSSISWVRASSSITRVLPGQRVLDVEHERGDVELGGVAGAGEHRQHAGLAEALLGEVVDDEAVAAEQLDAEVRRHVGGLDRSPATPASPRTRHRAPRGRTPRPRRAPPAGRRGRGPRRGRGRTRCPGGGRPACRTRPARSCTRSSRPAPRRRRRRRPPPPTAGPGPARPAPSTATAPTVPRTLVALHGTLTPPDAWKASDVTGSGRSRSPRAGAGCRPPSPTPSAAPASRAPTPAPACRRSGSTTVKRALGRAVEAAAATSAARPRSGQATTAPAARPGRSARGQPAGVGGGQRLEHHHLGEHAGVDAAERLRAGRGRRAGSRRARRAPVGPAAGGLVLPGRSAPARCGRAARPRRGAPPAPA